MARFVATHGVSFAEADEAGVLQVWAAFERAPELDTAQGEKRYVFETADAKLAKRLRAVDDYGIAEDTSSATPTE